MNRADNPFTTLTGGSIAFGQYDSGAVELADEEAVALRVDKHGRLQIADETAETDLQSYRSGSLEQAASVSSSASRLVGIKGFVDPNATDDEVFYVHVLDAAATPTDGDAIDPVTTYVLDHDNGYHSRFQSKGGRSFVGCNNGLEVVLSLGLTTYESAGLTGDDQAYFEVDYIEV
ncbi:MAG: hypothetical protein ABEN55_16555 [Bradymonadaceae bacterium]